MTANPACPNEAAAERAVNEVWESCFNDTRPFDEVLIFVTFHAFLIISRICIRYTDCRHGETNFTRAMANVFFLLWVRRRRFRRVIRCGEKSGWAFIIYKGIHRRRPLYRPIRLGTKILEGRLITRVCIEGTINSSDPVVCPYSCAHRRSSQPQTHLRLVLRSQMFGKLWLAHLSSL